RQRRQALLYQANPRVPRVGVAIELLRRELEDAARVESGVRVRDRDEAPEHEAAADEQHERQRDLGDRDAAPERAAAGPGAAAAGAQREHEVGTRGAER